MSTGKLSVVVLLSVFISLASMGLSVYSVTKSSETTPMIASASIALEEEFNWKAAEVVNIQGNMYGYLGYESITSNMVTMRLAKWQSGWMELTYSFTYVAPPYGPRLFQNFTLSPYILEVNDFQYFNLTARFIEN